MARTDRFPAMSNHPLQVEVAELLRSSHARRPLTMSVALDDLEATAARVRPGADVELDLVLESLPSAVMVSGTVAAPWDGECRRCLEATSGRLSVDLRELFEVEHTEDETFPIDGTRIDLEPVVREAVLLGLPVAPLCGEDCRGPAPEEFPARSAGELEAERAADAAQAPRDPRWAALDGIRFDETSG